MTKFTPIAFASEHWDQKINDTFTQIFAGGGGYVYDSGWQACATLVNGAHDYYTLANKKGDSTIKRRVLDFHKFKMVMITGALGAKYGDLAPGQNTLVKLPAGYPVSHNYAFGLLNAGTIEGYNRWDMTMDGKEIKLTASRQSSSIGSHPDYIIWLPINLWYISN